MNKNLYTRARLFFQFWRDTGTRSTLKLISRKVRRGLGLPIDDVHPPRAAGANPSYGPTSASVLNVRRFPNTCPIEFHQIPQASEPRITLVTDSIGPGSLFGGVGTALILGVLIANRMRGTLRILTRTEWPQADQVSSVLKAYDIAPDRELQFAFAPLITESRSKGRLSVDTYHGELFLTTSWWTTEATLAGIEPSSILYLLQEDERMFYAFGDERLRCEGVLARQDIRYIINTRLLFEHLRASGMAHLSQTGIWFEPTFPASLFHRRPVEHGAKRKFFFYARPNNPRNLFHMGVLAIERAVNEGILDLRQWQICFVGKDIPRLQLGDDYEPERIESMGWRDYADLIGKVDLGLSLMYTPHPSYPPLDLAASGAVVVTNKFGVKQDLSAYSPNIICADLTIEALVAALREGVARVELRSATDGTHYQNQNGIGPGWEPAFANILDALVQGR
ncbi:hypothetical protein QTH91_11735 [Variovorax dokdonensis]|uniref:Uncharacterized protein n=1 Tax=Variovorax dokdonensis TaxID=344883 RepID=A0ABT7NB49_9BURK|nr:hypothetical protein [Variovorax dokdonensis]MDM0045156.1 hypothetical protein [Variovorax dokdonensis]